MKLKLAAVAVAAVLAAPVFADTMVMTSPSMQVIPAGSELVIPAGSSASVIVEPPGTTAMVGSTTVLGAGPAVVTTRDAVQIDLSSGYALPPGSIHRADFQRWLRLWP